MEVYITDSARPLVAICESSAVMAKASRSDGAPAAHGSAVHRYAERAAEIGVEEALAEIPEDAEHRDHCVQLDTTRIPMGARFEVAMRWNRVTDEARVVGYSIGRDYPLRVAGDEDGTADVVALCEDETGRFVFVGDIKTGYRSTGPTATNEQLRSGAMKAAKIYGVRRARIATLVRQDGREERDYVTDLDSVDLDAIEAEHREQAPRLAQLRARYLSGERLPVVEGPHCQEMYCCAFAGCWAKQDLLAAGISGLIVLETGTPAIRLPSLEEMAEMARTEAGQVRLGFMYVRSREMRRILKGHVEGTIKGIGALIPGGLPLPDGQVLAEVEVASPAKVKPERVEAALQRALTPEDAAKALPLAVSYEPHATLTSIETGLRAIAKPGQLAGLKRAVREALRAEGGIVESSYLDIRAVSPKKLETT